MWLSFLRSRRAFARAKGFSSFPRNVKSANVHKDNVDSPSRVCSNFPKDHQHPVTTGAGIPFAQQKNTLPEVLSCGGRRGRVPVIHLIWLSPSSVIRVSLFVAAKKCRKNNKENSVKGFVSSQPTESVRREQRKNSIVVIASAPSVGAVDQGSLPSVCKDCKGTIYKTKLLRFSAALNTPSIIFFL